MSESSATADPPFDAPQTLDQAQALIAELVRRLEELERRLEEANATCETSAEKAQQLQAEVDLLKRMLYGRRSERVKGDPGQLWLSEEMSPETADAEPEEANASSDADHQQGPSPRRRRRRRHRNYGWNKLPDHLPRVEERIKVPEEQLTCPVHGVPLKLFDEERTERLDFEPGKLFVRVIIRPKYACPKESHTVVQPPAPAAPNPGGKFGFGVAALVVVNKFADHLPLYRQQDILARHGVTFSRSTLCGIVKGSAEHLVPLAALMQKRLLAVDMVGADDTPVRLLTRGEPSGSRLARFWLFHGFEAAPYNVFWFHESRSRDGPATFLADFTGYVKADAYGTDDGVYLGSGGRMIASGCWMHVRRYFEQAKDSSPRLAHVALGWIRQLYDIEDRARTFAPEERFQLRRQESAPIVDKVHDWLLEQKPQLRPKSAMAKAVNYTVNQWKPLITFLADGRLPIDNGESERLLRMLTVGRDNWKFIGSAAAGSRAAVLYTVLSSAHRHLLDEAAYLHFVMKALAEGISESEMESLLPDVWAKAHPESVRQFRVAERLQIAAAKAQRREERRQAAGGLILPS